VQRHSQIDVGDSQQFVLLSDARTLVADAFSTEKMQAQYVLENRRTALSLDDLYGWLLELGFRLQR